MINTDILVLPEEFVSACALYHISPETALLIFIWNVRVRHLLVQPEEKTGRLASSIIFLFMQKEKYVPLPVSEQQELMQISYVKKLAKEVVGKKESEVNKLSYNRLIQSWYQLTCTGNRNEKCQTSCGLEILLNREFYLTCHVLSCRAVDLLHYYVSHVSIKNALLLEGNYPCSASTLFFLEHI